MKIEYSKLVDLLTQGEKKNVDFKITCEAFYGNNPGANAELLKDICAMANNGNISSYIIIGVSDDGIKLKSVSNKNLNDENIQDYCRKNIYPPPKITVTRKSWSGSDKYNNTEFVIIQIGPNKRQAFRFTNSHIDYKNGFCYRNNEVWIRRGTTSDIATPEEVAKLVRGEDPEENIGDSQRLHDRQNFSKESLSSKKKLIFFFSKVQILASEYNESPKYSKLTIPNYLHYTGPRYERSYYWKIIGSCLILVLVNTCFERINKSELIHINGLMYKEYFIMKEAPKKLIALRDKYTSVRRIWLVPVLEKVSKTKIQQAYETIYWGGRNLHFYYKEYRIHNLKSDPDCPKNAEVISSSSEILIIDDIKSIPEFCENIESDLEFIEQNNDVIIPVTD